MIRNHRHAKDMRKDDKATSSIKVGTRVYMTVGDCIEALTSAKGVIKGAIGRLAVLEQDAPDTVTQALLKTFRKDMERDFSNIKLLQNF